MRTFLAVIALSVLSPFALAHGDHGKGHGSMMKEPTKEERTQMATMHTKMAECLGTEKPMADCHKEMMDSCPMAKEGKCPMMAMGHGPGHAHGKAGKMMKGKKAAEKTE